MAKRKVASTNSPAGTLANVKEVSAQQPASQPFWVTYQKYLLYAVGAVIVIIVGYMVYKTAYIAPQQKEAVGAMWQAQIAFERDSFRQALENPGGGFDGFITLADKYSGTAAGNLAKYYAGISYLNLGDMDSAIQYLEDFSPAGEILPAMKYGALGDAYSEKGEYEKALKLYEKAADATENSTLAPIYLKKLGLLYEYQGNKAEANKAFTRIKEEYPNLSSNEWREIDKYIYRTKQ